MYTLGLLAMLNRSFVSRKNPRASGYLLKHDGKKGWGMLSMAVYAGGSSAMDIISELDRYWPQLRYDEQRLIRRDKMRPRLEVYKHSGLLYV